MDADVKDLSLRTHIARQYWLTTDQESDYKAALQVQMGDPQHSPSCSHTAFPYSHYYKMKTSYGSIHKRVPTSKIQDLRWRLSVQHKCLHSTLTCSPTEVGSRPVLPNILMPIIIIIYIALSVGTVLYREHNTTQGLAAKSLQSNIQQKDTAGEGEGGKGPWRKHAMGQDRSAIRPHRLIHASSPFQVMLKHASK